LRAGEFLRITRICYLRLPSNIHLATEGINDIINYIDEEYGPLNDTSLFELKVVLNEIILNAVRHGNKEDEEKLVKIAVFIIDETFVGIVVEDEGNGYDVKELPRENNFFGADDISEIDEHGRGILIVNSLCEKVKVNQKGNRISVLKKIEYV